MASTANSTNAPSRRDFFGRAAGTALVGAVVGLPIYRTAIDLTAVAQAWIEYAHDLGMVVMRGPDGNLWRARAIDIAAQREEAQDRHWHKLNNRPRLLRAVHAAVERPARA